MKSKGASKGHPEEECCSDNFSCEKCGWGNCSCEECNCKECSCEGCSCGSSCSTGSYWPSSTKTRMVKIAKVREEFPGNKTFFMQEQMAFYPGQFVMAWLPGIDEKPIALIPWGKKYALNIEGKGIATKKMLLLKAGGKIGIRGPYGRPFTSRGVKKAAILAGGIGIDSIILLAEKLHRNGCATKIILGGRSRERIIFEKELGKYGEVLVATDDGSCGEKGYNTQILERLLKKGKSDIVYACGPEVMMVKAFELAKKHKTRFECSVERYMKCGIGVCGECVMNDKLTCVDGPIFNEKELAKMDEFGKTAYLKSGRRVSLKEYYGWRSE